MNLIDILFLDNWREELRKYLKERYEPTKIDIEQLINDIYKEIQDKDILYKGLGALFCAYLYKIKIRKIAEEIGLKRKYEQKILITEKEVIKTAEIIRTSKEKEYNFLEVLEILEEEPVIDQEEILVEEENFEEFLEKIEKIVEECEFFEFCSKHNLDIFKTFIAILFLAHYGKIYLECENGKIKIKR
jgi:hypothetical protein